MILRPSVAWTQADLDNIEAVIATGALTVIYAGPPQRQVTYQSTDALLRARAMIRRAVLGAPNFRRVQVSKGFRDADAVEGSDRDFDDFG